MTSGAALAFAATLLMLSAADAEAQFTRRIRDAVGKVAGQANPAAAGEEGTPARAGSPAFSDDVLEITQGRMQQFVRALDAERAARPALEQRYASQLAAYEEAQRTYPARQAAYDRQLEAWSAARQRHERCVEEVQARHDTPAATARAEAEQDSLREELDGAMDERRQRRLEELATRMQAAQARGDQKAMQAISDTVQRELRGVQQVAQAGAAAGQRAHARGAAMQREAERCPKPGEEPAPPESPNALMPADMAADLERAGAEAAGLTERQLAVLRERVETYVRLKGRTGSTQYVYSAAELEVLAANLEMLSARDDVAPTASWRTSGR